MKEADIKDSRISAAHNELPTERPDEFLDGEMFSNMVRGGAAQLRANAEEVNNLNVFPVPDGDTGDNMRMTIEGGVAAIEGVHTKDLAAVTQKLSRGMLLGARGNSGVILSQFFAGMTKGFAKHQRANAEVVGVAMLVGVKLAYASVISPVYESTSLAVSPAQSTSTCSPGFRLICMVARRLFSSFWI